MSPIKQAVESRRKYWQSLEERVLPEADAWRSPEFEQSRNEMADEAEKQKFSRKDFMKIMGAGAVMLSAACRRPTEQIVPAVVQAPEYVPGEKLFYASATPEGTGILIHAREGRPIKIAGNADHPITRGGVMATEVASLMDLYDPDRLRYPVTLRNGRKRRAAQNDIIAEAQSAVKAGNYVILTGPINSPSTKALIADFLKSNPGGRHLEMRPDPTLRQILEGQAASYGDRIVPFYRFDRAELVVTIEADFMGTMPGSSAYTADYMRGRDLRAKGSKYNSLIAFESMFTVTGSNAESRVPIRPGDAVTVALSLAAHINNGLKQGKFAGNAQVSDLLKNYMPEKVASALGIEAQAISSAADALWKYRGRSLVVGGSPQSAVGKAAALAIAVNLLNSILENDGVTVDHAHALGLSAGSSEKEILELVEDLQNGKVKSVIMAGANPVYHLPSSLKVKEALSNANYVLSITAHIDESTLAAKAALPVSHYLESWGDVEIVKGVRSVVQPAIRPLYNTSSLEDYLIQIAGGSLGGASSFHEYLKSRWADVAKGSFNDFWIKTLQAGFLASTSLKGQAANRNFNTAALQALPVSPETKAGLRVGLYYNVQVLDGTGANNAYRQELPEPVTKAVWMNYAVILPETARQMKLKQGSVIEVKTPSGSVKVPVLLQPGIHPEAILIALGYGRTAAGKIGDARGANAIELARVGTDSLILSGLELAKEGGLVATGDRIKLPNTQTVYRSGRNTEDRAFFAPKQEYTTDSAPMGAAALDGSAQYGRPLIREASLEDYRKDPTNEHIYTPDRVEYPDNAAIMTGWKYEGIRWHMAIDLNACTGCGSCVTSCNIENNIPMVGPDQVYIGREMHWLRIDRYYSGSEANPTVAHQPMLCQHCENAPCENVCPVGATAHDTEGLNVMAYNRCVGTRYCANNCPYKVRRFNWFENWDYMEGLVRHLRDPQQLGLNPDVTVRRRGVIEKCSLCIHRLNRARQDMKVKGQKKLVDGSVQTACQEVCPSNAITFGDINDKDSRVHQLAADNRGYKVLDFLATNPSITYLAKVRNKVI